MKIASVVYVIRIFSFPEEIALLPFCQVLHKILFKIALYLYYTED